MSENQVTLREIGECGDHMKLADFIRCVEAGAFIDYDGFGNLATETQESSQEVKPSQVVREGYSAPPWATHVVWYNR